MEYIMGTMHLRRIGVFVDESDPGDFYWVLIESKEDSATWEDLVAAEEPVHSWREAFDLGTAALLNLVDDQKRGPLAAGEDENASPVGGGTRPKS
ncbi:MAG: hypothetical protein Q7T39_02625 [Polaromonas sp.]|nr:hypothetical protein [Polaromonas sp.]